jgi:hypothetical protein
MNCGGGHKMRLHILLMGAAVSLGAIFSGCNSSGNDGITLTGYTFHSDSASLTNRYFPDSVGHVISFAGHGSFEGSSYTWMFTEGEVIQGVATVHEKGFLTNPKGETSILFDSMLAQDVQGKVHVLKNGGALSGVAAGLTATILMPGNPKVGDCFAPGTNYTGTVLSLNETVDSYAGVLHTRFIVDQSDNKKDQYDDYWAPGIGQVKSVWSLADGTTGYWVRLYPDIHTMQADLQACMQPGTPGEDARLAYSEKYKVPLSELQPPGANEWDFHYWGMIACHWEMETLPGAILWRIRANLDGWTFTDACGGDLDWYCRQQAQHCNHWQWHQGELESTIGGSCFRH